MADIQNNSKAYRDALAAVNEALREYQPIRTDYRAGLVDEKVFLAARVKYMAAAKVYDEAFLAEQNRMIGEEQ